MCAPSAELKQNAVCTIMEQKCLSQQIVEKTKHKSGSFLRRQLMIANYHIKKFIRNSQQYFLQDKMWIEMPKWTIFFMSSDVFVLITENFWRIFWRNFWRHYLTPYKTPAFLVTILMSKSTTESALLKLD